MTPLNTNSSWVDAVQSLQKKGCDYVLVTVLGTRGSTPRDASTKMVFGNDSSFGTVGGGNLEFKVAEIAGQMVGTEGQRIEYFPLGPGLGQCCGGSTSVLFESFVGCQLDIALFGAGHVGRTLAPLLDQMPCRLHWFDSRDLFAADAASDRPGDDPQPRYSDDPAAEVTSLPANSWFVIMTHNHQLDYGILKAAIARGDADYIGMIGSLTKWRRFQMRLEHEGFRPEQFANVDCPIGNPDVPGKRPIEVAVSVAARLIQRYHDAGVAPDPVGVPRRELIEAMTAMEFSKEDHEH